MHNSTFKKMRVALIAVLGTAVLSACSYTNQELGRVYMLDSNCTYYYINGAGVKVYDGMYSKRMFMYENLQRDSNGRLYYQDSWGNIVYVSKYCCARFMHKMWGTCHR